MIDADRITRVIAQRCPELTLTDLAAVDSGLYGDATNAILVKRLRRLHRRLGADRRQTGRLGSRRMIDPADVKILASHCAYDVLQSEEAVFVVEEFYAGRLDPIAVLRLSMCDRNVGSLRSAGDFPVGLLDRPGPRANLAKARLRNKLSRNIGRSSRSRGC
jgi:hypothetical protein